MCLCNGYPNSLLTGCSGVGDAEGMPSRGGTELSQGAYRQMLNAQRLE